MCAEIYNRLQLADKIGYVDVFWLRYNDGQQTSQRNNEII
jgi:hypothetical protein